MTTTLVLAHTCAGIDHEESITFARSVKLNCGCVRHEGTRCDGTAVHHIVGLHCERQIRA